MPKRGSPSVTYADAGVSIERGDELVERIIPAARRTRRRGVMGGIGGFGALFDLSSLGCRQPVLVSGTDGVGTKIKLAIDSGRHDTIGIDLVAMCVNDVLVQGAEPLYFLDYFATGRLEVDVAERVVKGVARGCRIAGCALAGGETAEMPGLYRPGDYDLAGFAVGVVEKKAIIDGRGIAAGDALIGLASSGAHSNGYSLIRKLLGKSGVRPAHRVGGRPLLDVLMEPTRIYVKPVLALMDRVAVKGMAHITGGGITENVPRMLPEKTAAVFRKSSWPRPPVFDWLQRTGNIAEAEMLRTFNCGIGMVLVVAKADARRAVAHLSRRGEKAWIVGEVRPRRGRAPRVLFTD
ncbi:MAG TPA: phosphoribosylformylglycinamidine cyclo-ligase [Gammaproteobacteria bacterium]|jgi:phosphoribosylformylglycinamidine cyclo-ligase